MGVSLNFQELLDRTKKHGGLHFIGEMYQPPYTTLSLGGLRRYGASATSSAISGDRH